MSEQKVDRARLERRRSEILDELDRVNRDLHIQLDPSNEEQAIELEQTEVPMTMEQSLRAELDRIDEQLADDSA
jgi:hypothetical protein